MQPSGSITVIKLDDCGQEVWRYRGRVLERGEAAIRLEAYFDRATADLGVVLFNRGDRFVETFYANRWYNVFAVYDGDGGELKGWYCNICRPAEISEDTVRCEDLALDVWVATSGEIYVLDEEEFAGLALTPEEQRETLGALRTIERLAEQRQLPA